MTSIEYKKTFGNRQRSSSFNHSVTNKKYSTRRPSYDILSTKKSIQFLNIEQPTAYSASSIDESNSDLEEDEDDDTQNITDYYLYRDEEEEHKKKKNYHSSHHNNTNRSNNKSQHSNTNSNSSHSNNNSNNNNNSSSSSNNSTGDKSTKLYDDGSCHTYPPKPNKENGKRDKYGFLKSSQWITEEEYDEFENYYAPIMKRRLVKWKQLLQEHHQQWPPRSNKLKRYIRKGIPAELRGQTKMEANKGLYDELLHMADQLGSKNENLEIIERDLHRTFPENDQFKSIADSTPPMIEALKRVLVAFSIYAPSIGYCQSLNYIAGILLLLMTEEEAFWTFVTLITDILPPNIYDVTMEGANIDQNVLMHLISERYPLLWNKMSPNQSFWECEAQLEGGMPTCSLVTSHWFLTLFINILPIESVLRVWDCLFYDGQKVLFRVALGIFKLNENAILAVNDPLEVFQVIQNMPKRMIDCHRLIDSTYQQYAATTRLNDQEITDRRELFKKRRDERRRNIPVQHGSSRKLLKRSTVRGALIHRAKEARWYVERAKSVQKNKT
ncbi:hypothetical protein RMCBS344292_18388 [Rhizopus microsporus]|nr:hypothetical protein RMCBS344292_18388 [Rhizopus microsporus]